VSTSTKNVVLYDCSRNENVLFVTLLGDDRNTKGTTLLGCVAIMNSIKTVTAINSIDITKSNHELIDATS